MSDADYLTAQTLSRLSRSGNCCEILMSVPVYSGYAVYVCSLVSGHMEFSETMNLIMQMYRISLVIRRIIFLPKQSQRSRSVLKDGSRSL